MHVKLSMYLWKQCVTCLKVWIDFGKGGKGSDKFGTQLLVANSRVRMGFALV